jgi:hypothetical protein
MTDLGAFASEFNVNSKALKLFNEALRTIKEPQRSQGRSIDSAVDNLLLILRPIRTMISGRLSSSLMFDEVRVVELLHVRHEKDWQAFIERLSEITEKLPKSRFPLSNSDYDILNDVADAMDMQCAHLFKRISGRI